MFRLPQSLLPLIHAASIHFRNRVALSVITVYLSLFFLPIPHAGAAVRTVTVGVYENPPKIFTSETGKPSGIFVDVINPGKGSTFHLSLPVQGKTA